MQGNRNYRSVKQTVKRLEEASVSCRGPERILLLRRWLFVLKEVDKLLAASPEDKQTTLEQHVFTDEGNESPRKQSMVSKNLKFFYAICWSVDLALLTHLNQSIFSPVKSFYDFEIRLMLLVLFFKIWNSVVSWNARLLVWNGSYLELTEIRKVPVCLSSFPNFLLWWDRYCIMILTLGVSLWTFAMFFSKVRLWRALHCPWYGNVISVMYLHMLRDLINIEYQYTMNVLHHCQTSLSMLITADAHVQVWFMGSICYIETFCWKNCVSVEHLWRLGKQINQKCFPWR